MLQLAAIIYMNKYDDFKSLRDLSKNVFATVCPYIICENMLGSKTLIYFCIYPRITATLPNLAQGDDSCTRRSLFQSKRKAEDEEKKLKLAAKEAANEVVAKKLAANAAKEAAKVAAKEAAKEKAAANKDDAMAAKAAAKEAAKEAKKTAKAAKHGKAKREHFAGRYRPVGAITGMRWDAIKLSFLEVLNVRMKYATKFQDI